MRAIVLALALMQTMLPFTTVARGEQSGIDAPREVVIRTAKEWEGLWKAHSPAAPAPRVDFSSALVVGVFLGTRPSAGFQIEITDVTTDGDAAVVEYVERRPGPGAIVAQILTAPFHLVSLARRDGEIRFRKVNGTPK